MTPNEVELDVLDVVIAHLKVKVKSIKNAKAKAAYDTFNSLSLSQKREILIEWVDCQNKAIYESVKNGIPLVVPALGTFKINVPSLIFDDFKREIANEFGYRSFSDCPTDVKRVVNNIAKERQKEVQYERYFKTLKKNRGNEIFDIKLPDNLNLSDC